VKAKEKEKEKEKNLTEAAAKLGLPSYFTMA
jgi:hypothetical protein